MNANENLLNIFTSIFKIFAAAVYFIIDLFFFCKQRGTFFSYIILTNSRPFHAEQFNRFVRIFESYNL